MPLNSTATTSNYDECRLDKPNARGFSVQVGNQTVLYQLNVPTFGRGENWMPLEGIQLRPGYWNFDQTDFSDYGADTAQGIRFRALDTTDPGIVTAS